MKVKSFLVMFCSTLWYDHGNCEFTVAHPVSSTVFNKKWKFVQDDVDNDTTFLLSYHSTHLPYSKCSRVSIPAQGSDISASLQNYALLPKIYDFNETETCLEDHVHCKVDIKLTPMDEKHPSELWKLIEQANNEHRVHFKRDMVFRGLCAKENSLNTGQLLYEENGVVGTVEEAYCQSKVKYTEMMDLIDISFIIVVIMYISFIIYCTLKTYNSKRSEKNGNSKSQENKYTKNFSIINTWEDIKKPNKSEDFNKLLSIQGLRTLSIVGVITAHNFVTLLLSFSENTEYLTESFYNHPYKRLLPSSFGLIVQSFFVFSSWLLAVQLNNIIKKNGRITLKDVLILSLNRYFRLIPEVIVVVLCHRSTILLSALFKPPYHSFAQLEISRCLNGWWRSLFFIQNLSSSDGQICSPGTWYIASDTQMYLMVLVFFYVGQKFKISLKYILGLAVSAAICIQGYTALTADFDALLKFNPMLLPGENFFIKPVFLFSYASSVCNMASYIIGFGFGTVYSENKDKNIFDTTVKKLGWFCAFFGLPLLATILYPNQTVSRGFEVISAITVRPLFSLGIAIGILGMATKTGGYVKKFCEWRPLVFLGSFTYCIYMFHFMIVFGRFTASNYLANFSDSFYLFNLARDIISSFILGAIMFIILEYPCGQLQKMVLPQVRTKKETEKIKDS